MQKLIIFDWGRTLYDPETKDVFLGVPEMLRTLSNQYKLAIVCLATDGDFDRRKKIMKDSGVEELFSLILMAEGNKDLLYEKALSELGFVPKDVIIVDDRTLRGIRWGNANGATTVWVCKGKFSNELPNEETGEPDYTVTEVTELLGIL